MIRSESATPTFALSFPHPRDPGLRERWYDLFGMPLSEGRFAVLVAFALLWSSVQCAAFCATEPCIEGISTNSPVEPPCHHHQTPSNQAPAPCQHQQLAQADVPQASVMPVSHDGLSTFLMSVPLVVVSPVAVLTSTVVHPLAPSDVLWPPGPVVLSSVVLRI